MTLNRMMLLFSLLTLHLLPLFALALFAFPVRHLLMSLSLQHFALPRISFAVAVQLGRRMLHRLTDARKRVAGAMRRLRMLSVWRRLVWSTGSLSQICQTGQRVS